MASGNFLVGQKGLSMQNFMEYVAPKLTQAGYAIPDRLAVRPGLADERVLISLVGKDDLEGVLNSALVEAGKEAEAARDKAFQSGSRDYTGAYRHQLSGVDVKWEGQTKKTVREFGLYEVLGIYGADDAASQLFVSRAQPYLLAVVQEVADEALEKLETWGKRLTGSSD